jgi:hypothetical protein
MRARIGGKGGLAVVIAAVEGRGYGINSIQVTKR